MKSTLLFLIPALCFFASCVESESTDLSSFEVFCEMVGSDAKPLALSHPMSGDQVDRLWKEFLRLGDKYQVSLYREDDFPVSALFPVEVTKDKSVVIIYRGSRLEQYLQWKRDIEEWNSDVQASKSVVNQPGENRGEDQEALARRLGRLLGYSPQGINRLLEKNTGYRNLNSFEVKQQVTHLYYKDVSEALEFYKSTLGLVQKDSTAFQISADAFLRLHPFDESHPEGQAKSTAIALLTDQLPEWYAHLQENNIPIKYAYKPREGGPHDGFVAVDPGGYLLEFEQFKQHPENELFMAVLAGAPVVETSASGLSFFGSITWTYHKDLLAMQRFYEEVLGYRQVADQGWTKIYQSSQTGFIGLVDERRGMQDYAETKAVEIEWKISDMPGFLSYAEANWQSYGFRENTLVGPEAYTYRIKHYKDFSNPPIN